MTGMTPDGVLVIGLVLGALLGLGAFGVARSPFEEGRGGRLADEDDDDPEMNWPNRSISHTTDISTRSRSSAPPHGDHAALAALGRGRSEDGGARQGGYGPSS